jgi:hypothetical protein
MKIINVGSDLRKWMVQAQLLRCMDGPSQWTYIFRWWKYSFSFLMLSFWGSFQGLVEVFLQFYRLQITEVLDELQILYFFSRTHTRAVYHYIKKSKRGEDPPYNKHYNLGDSPGEQEPTRPWPHIYYPGAAVAWSRDRPLAPATVHSRASSLTASRAADTHGASPSKTHRFLCFQIIHAPNTAKELKPFLCCSSCTRREEARTSPRRMPLLAVAPCPPAEGGQPKTV